MVSIVRSVWSPIVTCQINDTFGSSKLLLISRVIAGAGVNRAKLRKVLEQIESGGVRRSGQHKLGELIVKR